VTIRTGVVGLGMGRHHAQTYSASADADLVAVCDLNEELLAKYEQEFGATTYTQYEEMFTKAGLDAVSIALPNFLDAKVAIAAMQAGLDVLCEKPMALSAAEAEEMLRVSKETGQKLMIHFNYRYSGPSRFLKSYLDKEGLGQIYYARTRWLRARGIPKLGGWFGIKKLSGGGPIIDLGVHRIDLAMWLMGYPRAISVSAYTSDLLGARLARESGASYDVENLAMAMIRLENGATLNLEVSWAGGTDRQEDMLTGIYGTEGAVVQQNYGEGYDFEAYVLKDMGGQYTRIKPLGYPSDVPNAVDDFIDCVIEDRAPDASAENGLEMMRILDAIYKSAEEGREVRLD